MAVTVFQALDKAIEAGGENLTAANIAGPGRAAAALLDQLCSSGLLAKGAGRSPRYTITAQGREAWEREAPESRRQEVKRRQEGRQRQTLVEFVTLVKKKQGKALSRAEQARFSDAIRQAACDCNLVEPGARANCYNLLAAGEETILAEQPAEDQVKRLRQLSAQLAAQWRAAQGRLDKDLDGAGGGVALREAGGRLGERGRSALQAFDAAVAELGAFAVLSDAARRLRAEGEEATRQALQAVEAEKERMAGLESRLRQEVEQQRAQIAAFERTVEGRLADLARKLDAPKEARVEEAPQTKPAGSPSDDAVWEVTRVAHERLRQQSLRIGGIVKVPELTDAVTATAAGLPRARFHDLLRKWQQDDRLTLQLCNDPRLEPRAEEGIQSPRGLLFYVQMR